jgi:hypothetical protein
LGFSSLLTLFALTALLEIAGMLEAVEDEGDYLYEGGLNE